LEELRVAKIGIDSRAEAYSPLTRLAVVHDYPLRMKIVTELYMREMSPKEFFDEFGGGSISRVCRHFEKLAEYSSGAQSSTFIAQPNWWFSTKRPGPRFRSR
jgi:hypothetical protein